MAFNLLCGYKRILGSDLIILFLYFYVGAYFPCVALHPSPLPLPPLPSPSIPRPAYAARPARCYAATLLRCYALHATLCTGLLYAAPCVFFPHRIRSALAMRMTMLRACHKSLTINITSDNIKKR